MNRTIQFFFLLFGASLLSMSCQDVIEVDLPPTEKRLVIDALIPVPDNDSSNIVARIRLTETTDYYADSVPAATGAVIELRGETSTFRLDEEANGYYSTVVPREIIMNEMMSLTVIHKDETYRSTTQYVPSVPIDSLKQGDKSLFGGDETEIIIAYKDVAPREDFYLFNLDRGQFLTSEDTFYQGQAFSFSYFYENIEPRDTLDIQLLGITKPFYDYMSIVINQSGQNSGNPFAAPPSDIRGNIINETDEGHYPLGYFSISQAYYENIIIE